MGSEATNPQLAVRHPELVGTFPHHPDCPGCLHDRVVDHCVRNIEAMRRARIRDDTIRMTLANGWYHDWLIEDAFSVLETIR